MKTAHQIEIARRNAAYDAKYLPYRAGMRAVRAAHASGATLAECVTVGERYGFRVTAAPGGINYGCPCPCDKE